MVDEAELAILAGFDQDLAGESTRTSNRLRGLLTQIHPSLERVLGPRIAHPTIPVAVGDADTFPTSDHLASNAGSAPVTKSSDSSNAPCSSPPSPHSATQTPAPPTKNSAPRAKPTPRAILRLARRRINVLYAMLRDGAFYTPRTITT